MRASHLGHDAAVLHTHQNQIADIGAHQKQSTIVTHAQIGNSATAIVAERHSVKPAIAVRTDESHNAAVCKSDKH